MSQLLLLMFDLLIPSYLCDKCCFVRIETKRFEELVDRMNASIMIFRKA